MPIRASYLSCESPPDVGDIMVHYWTRILQIDPKLSYSSAIIMLSFQGKCFAYWRNPMVLFMFLTVYHKVGISGCLNVLPAQQFDLCGLRLEFNHMYFDNSNFKLLKFVVDISICFSSRLIVVIAITFLVYMSSTVSRDQVYSLLLV